MQLEPFDSYGASPGPALSVGRKLNLQKTDAAGNAIMKLRGRSGGIALVVLSRALSTPPRWLCYMALASTLSGCGDPVIDEPMAALGPEDPAVQPGPLHRPGQPCVLCHSKAGGESVLSLAGTVYVDAMNKTPIDDVNVLIVDSQNRKWTAKTNCAGNFMVRDSEFKPDFPVWLGLRRGSVERTMNTPVYREGSCSACHQGQKSPSSAGQVYLIEDPANEPAPVSNCR